MADPITSNLYPPIVETFMPAFTADNCKIYFELSDFNTIADINTNLIQVSVRNQKNNENSLKNSSGIRYYTLQIDSDNRYYITIEDNHLISGFQKNIYYKVQIRFTSVNVDIAECYVRIVPDPNPESTENPHELGWLEFNNITRKYFLTSDTEVEDKIYYENYNPSMTWINQHLDLFSEWSTVCLIRRITEPQIKQNSLVFPTGGDHYEYETPFLRFNGKVQFGPNEEEYLKEYRLRLYTTTDSSPYDNGELIEDSGIQYPDRDIDVNKILYNFTTKLQGDSRYNLYVDIVTNNLYQKTTSYIGFLTSFDQEPANTLSYEYIEDPDQGRIGLNITDSSPLPADYIIITRTSNRSDFTKYDEVAVLTSEDIDNPFYDSSIESGIWYSYAIQKYNNGTYYGVYEKKVRDEADPTIEKIDPIMIIYEDVFLNSQGKQLKLRYDSRLTSYKRVTMENKTEPLGSTYPFVRKNSATNYKQFSLNGLITFHTDESEIFITEKELYGSQEAVTKYHNYNIEDRIHEYNDYIKEREFREKVLDFLYSSKVFLLRTITEGLILVRLTDINVTPNQSLNNYICNFTATVTEIGECTPENYYKYKIFPYLYSSIQLER